MIIISTGNIETQKVDNLLRSEDSGKLLAPGKNKDYVITTAVSFHLTVTFQSKLIDLMVVQLYEGTKNNPTICFKWVRV